MIKSKSKKKKKKLCISAMMANGVVEGKPIVWPEVSPQGFPTTPQSVQSGDGCEPVISLSGEVEKAWP